MLSFNVEDKNAVTIIHIHGELYHDKVPELERIWDIQLSKPSSTIAINCGNLIYIDSPAIGALVRFLNEAMKKGKKLVFFDLNPDIRKLFDTARLERFFVIASKETFEANYLK